jgi:Flp pilus assembly protein TadD/ABC-type cobalt transport system substrate-binding protein
MASKKKSKNKNSRPEATALAERTPPQSLPQQRSGGSARTEPLPANSLSIRMSVWLAAGFLVLVTLLVYSNSFGGSFIYDDDQAVNKNTSIEHLWPPWGPLFPPANLTVGGRPLLNLSFAINYAINGRHATWSYHILNFLAHAFAGLTLLGVLRRTFLQPVLRKRYGADAFALAVAITLLWMVNPLQTESVSYISQRAEAFMGLFYLLTIYCFIRSVEDKTALADSDGAPWDGLLVYVTPERWTRQTWMILACVSCYCGAAFKEITISAPIMVLLYDRTFVAGTFFQALRRRRWFYTALALGCWAVIAWGLKDYRGGRVIGYDYGITGLDYALTECPALLHYIYLMVWPNPLIIDYGTKIYLFSNYDDFVDCLMPGLVVVTLLVATVVALVKWPRVGFICAWFFLILAPTSSFFPIVVSPIGEHRLYLPLLTFLVPLTLAFRYFLGRGPAFWIPVVALATIYGLLSFLRNDDYATDVNLWAVTVGQEPNNARAHNNYGVTLLGAGRAAEAADQFQMATTLQPSYPDAHYNWGNATAQLGRYQEAIGHYQVALEQKPNMGSAQNNWGNALDAMGPQYEPEALNHYLIALQINPYDPQFHYNIGHAYLVLKRLPDALEQFHEALALNPNLPDTHNTLGIVYFQMGDKEQAIEEFRTALSLNPNLQAARDNLIKLTGQGQ